MKRLMLFTFVGAFVGAFASPALAHGHRDVGSLVFTVGWASEPAFAGEPNAVQLNIERDGKPVEGAEKSLEVEVALGEAKTEPLEMRTVFDSPGEYRADLIPTAPGGYTFHFTGDIDGEKLDESFTSPKDDFSEVQGNSEIAFPKEAPTTTELTDRIVTLEGEIADARSAAALPRTLGIVGIVLGAAAIVLGTRRRSG